MKKQKPEEPENHERWLISYADFITLLFAFFVVMYSTSSVNAGKLRAVADAMNSAFNPFVTLSATNIRLMESRIGTEMFDVDMKRYFKIQETVRLIDAGKSNITVAKDSRGLVIRISDTLVFEPGRADILPQNSELLDRVAALLAEIPNQIIVEGHTDNVPIRTPQFPSNWELAVARATTIVRYFVEHRTIDPQRIAIGGYGEFRPIAWNDTPEGRAKNRRVDIVVLQTPRVQPDEGDTLDAQAVGDPSAQPAAEGGAQSAASNPTERLPGAGLPIDDPFADILKP
ncbi:MAG: flagellar motor protein MotB [Nitrospirota bacterium]